MAANESLPLAKVEEFYKEAVRRGCYTTAQESLLSTWKTLLSTVLPAAGVDTNTVTAGRLKEELESVLKVYGSKTNVKSASIRTYEAKGTRLLTDFIEYNGAADTKWYSWKERNEKKSQQASAAAQARGKKAVQNGGGNQGNGGGSVGIVNVVGVDGDAFFIKLPNGRRAELRLPADVTEADLGIIENIVKLQFAVIKAQLGVDKPEVNKEKPQP